MAANSLSRGISTLGKRFVNRVPALSLAARRGVHASVYDKNLDDQVRGGTVVPDDLIEPQSDKYWAPHPNTGVFGPASTGEQPGVDHGKLKYPIKSADGTETVWFRPLENIEKPQQP